MRGAVAETVWDSSTIPLILITLVTSKQRMGRSDGGLVRGASCSSRGWASAGSTLGTYPLTVNGNGEVRSERDRVAVLRLMPIRDMSLFPPADSTVGQAQFVDGRVSGGRRVSVIPTSR